jgi:hypothetical protein
LALPTKKLFLGLVYRKIRSMIKKISSLALLIAISTAVMGQSAEKTKKYGRPDIPGTFVMDLGFNRLTEKPNDLKYGLWGSRTLNVYYYYDMRIGTSKFSFHPGIGFGMERFKLISSTYVLPGDTITRKRTSPTLIFDDAGNTTFMDAGRVIYDGDTLGGPDFSNSYRTKKSMLVMNYLDIPVELRFSLRPDDPGRSFKIAIGGRVGYLLGSHTKIKYKEDGDMKKFKDKQNFNLSPFRYSAYMRIYFGNFNIFGYYNLNPVFQDGKGPMQTKAASYTIGVSLASF